jgi:hypothetical protein
LWFCPQDPDPDPTDKKINADPCGSGSTTLVSRKKEYNVEYQIAFPGVHNWIKCRTESRERGATALDENKMKNSWRPLPS